MSVERVLLASPRGFCAGVEMSIKALAWMVRAFPPPVYCYHEIVHNRVVADRFRDQGVRFITSVSEVPEGSPLMLSAHGSSPAVIEEARRRTTLVVDAVCPLVTKVHTQLRSRARTGYVVVYLGEEGHDEAVGTMAVAPEAVRLVRTPEDVRALELDDRPVALLSQTTLTQDDWNGVHDALRESASNVWLPRHNDLCYATTNRQAAVMALSTRCDHVVVVGSPESSNTKSLAKTAERAGIARVHRVNSADELPDDIAGVVGVTAGASAPDETIEEILGYLDPAEGIELVDVLDEDEYFPPPRDLRKLLEERPDLLPYDFENDRDISASDSLRDLANQ